MSKKHIRHIVSMLLFAPTISLMFIVPPLSAAEEVTAIRGGDLYTITGGIIKNGTILIKDGKIADIGQNIEIPKKAKVIDAHGKVIMPGLVAVGAELGIIGYPNITKIADSLDPFDFSVSLSGSIKGGNNKANTRGDDAQRRDRSQPRHGRAGTRTLR